MSQVWLAITTCPNAAVAEEVARGLVDAECAACVNISAAGRSIYRWQGKICADDEHVLLIKTTSDAWDQMAAWLNEHHPYDTPELIGWPIERGSAEYLDWVNDSVQK